MSTRPPPWKPFTWHRIGHRHSLTVSEQARLPSHVVLVLLPRDVHVEAGLLVDDVAHRLAVGRALERRRLELARHEADERHVAGWAVHTVGQASGDGVEWELNRLRIVDHLNDL